MVKINKIYRGKRIEVGEYRIEKEGPSKISLTRYDIVSTMVPSLEELTYEEIFEGTKSETKEINGEMVEVDTVTVLDSFTNWLNVMSKKYKFDEVNIVSSLYEFLEETKAKELYFI